MMHQLVFVIDGIIVSLHKNDFTASQAKRMDENLVQLYVDWNKMYIFSRKDEFTESDLKAFQVSDLPLNSCVYIDHCLYK